MIVQTEEMACQDCTAVDTAGWLPICFLVLLRRSSGAYSHGCIVGTCVLSEGYACSNAWRYAAAAV